MMTTGIITAASEKYANSLLSLIGSLNCNWPNHPTILVFNLGLKKKTIKKLEAAGIEVKEIPPFCSHWRAHYTWKVWCMAHSNFDLTIWMDSGICVLEPLDDILDFVKREGYFLIPNYQFLDYEVSEETCKACGVPYSFRIGKGSVAGTFIGFLKNSRFGELIKEVFTISLDEHNIRAYNSRHKHDQSIISVLTYKYFPNPVLHDGVMYLGWKSPRMVNGQKVWLQRRQILKEDVSFFDKYLIIRGVRHMPKDPWKDIGFLRRIYRISKTNAKTLVNRMLKYEHKDGIR